MVFGGYVHVCTGSDVGDCRFSSGAGVRRFCGARLKKTRQGVGLVGRLVVFQVSGRLVRRYSSGLFQPVVKMAAYLWAGFAASCSGVHSVGGCGGSASVQRPPQETESARLPNDIAEEVAVRVAAALAVGIPVAMGEREKAGGFVYALFPQGADSGDHLARFKAVFSSVAARVVFPAPVPQCPPVGAGHELPSLAGEGGEVNVPALDPVHRVSSDNYQRVVVAV